MRDTKKENITSPEFELYSLQQQLRKVSKGSQEYQRILDEIEILRESMDARAQLFHRLLSAHDTERIQAILESKIIAEQRFDAQLRQLLELDLTFPEAMRLGRLISQRSQEIESRLATSQERQKERRKKPN